MRSRLLTAAAGLLVLAAVLFFVLRRDAPATAVFADRPSNVILVTIDTLRADALGYAGNRRVQTPYIDSLAAGGMVFTNAHAHNTVTLPSHVNILTGLLPYQHGVRDNAGFKLDPKHRTLAHYLKANGYATGAFIGAFPLDKRFGLAQDFGVYDDRYREGSRVREFVMEERPASDVITPAAQWWSATPGKKFLWVHVYDPHAPYLPPAPFAEQYRDNPYLGEVAYTDSQLRALLEPILERDPDSLVILTADHGEALGDHGELTHGLFAYESTLKVPLIVYHRDSIKRASIDRFVRHIDIVPTVLQLAGIEKPKEMQGSSLLDPNGAQDTYFEALSASFNRGWAPLVGMIHDSKKYIELPVPELYDLHSDPAEKTNLVTTDRRATTAIRKLMASAAPLAQSAEGRNISAEDRSRLLSLGYISGNVQKKNYTAEDDPKNLTDLDNDMHRVTELYQRGDIRKAVELAQQVVRKRPGMASSYEMLGFLLQESERPADAIELLRSAIAAGTATEHMRVRLGLTLSESGRAKEAVEVLAPLAAKSDDPDLLNAYGIALGDSGRVGESLDQFRRVLKVDSTNAKAYQNYGIIALRAGDSEDARQHLLRALQLNDRLPLALNAIGVIYARERNFPQAIEAWARAVELDPKQFDAMFNLAFVSGTAGRWPLAIQALDRFISTAPPERYAADIVKAKAMREEARRRMSGTGGTR